MKALLFSMLFLFSSAFAVADMYQFENPQQQRQFELLTQQLRCLVCQNQNLADSNAGLAEDLREEIYQQITAGANNQQIIHYMVRRYGDYVLFRPPFNGATLLLWLTPFLLLLGGVGYLLFKLNKQRQ